LFGIFSKTIENNEKFLQLAEGLIFMTYVFLFLSIK